MAALLQVDELSSGLVLVTSKLNGRLNVLEASRQQEASSPKSTPTASQVRLPHATVHPTGHSEAENSGHHIAGGKKCKPISYHIVLETGKASLRVNREATQDFLEM